MSLEGTTPDRVESIVRSTADEGVGPVRRRFRSILGNRAYITTAAIVAPISGVATIVLVIRDLFNIHGDGWAIVLACFVAVLVLLAIAALYNEQARHREQVDTIGERFRAELRNDEEIRRNEVSDYQRKARMYSTLPHVHQVFHELRDAQAIVMAHDPSEAVDALVFAKLQTILSEFAAAFSDLTGFTCRASIKSLEVAEGAPDRLELGQDEAAYSNALVSTLARNDRTATGDVDGAVKIIDNTDFLYLLRAPDGGLRCFFSNDLDVDPAEYRNSHRSRDRVAQAKPQYNSAIVWPIQKLRDRPGKQQRFGLVGFLCVDSLATHCFEKSYDFELGAAVADGLFSLIWFWRSNATVLWPNDVPNDDGEPPAPADPTS